MCYIVGIDIGNFLIEVVLVMVDDVGVLNICYSVLVEIMGIKGIL